MQAALPTRLSEINVIDMQKKSLGKGLGALISGAARRFDAPGSPSPTSLTEQGGPNGNIVEMIPVAQIVSSPMQPRKSFRDEHLDELMESIREHGLIQPLVVRRVNGNLELIAGERRFRASQKLGLTEVPVLVREKTDREVLEMALVENLQREDLNPIEESEAYCRLAQEFNMKQEEIAQSVGKNRATVANSMRLIDLTPEVKILLIQGRITTGHAKAVLSLKTPALQNLIADMVVRQSMTVRQTEKQVQNELDGSKATTTRPSPAVVAKKSIDPHLAMIQNRLRDRLATQVQLHHGKTKGRIEIEYYGDDDLERLLEVLGVKID